MAVLLEPPDDRYGVPIKIARGAGLQHFQINFRRSPVKIAIF